MIDVVHRLEDTSGNLMPTVFDPKDNAAIALHHKHSREYDERSRRNIAKWISAHIVPSHPIELVGSQSTMLRGKSIDFECKGEGEKTWEHCTLEHGVRDSPACRGV
ncbi:hypothetical protein RSAG8_07332, partial [Rhizoctonia solani AG-8 WAC10335]